MTPPAAVLLDIEGTTTPIRFVHDVLFPYARTRLPALLSTRVGEPEVAAALADVPGPDQLATLLGWMDRDEKATPLKALQGLLWRDGYAAGTLRGALYPDVTPHLRAWAAAGVGLAVYSSGSEEAQRQLFGHSVDGDVVPLFAGFFDTRVGGKRSADSYAAILGRLDLPGPVVLFLSDVEAELEAAEAAGLQVCQLVRAADGTVASSSLPAEAEFAGVARRFGLPPAAIMPQ